ncbi:MAG: hypothetical protein QOF89_2492 [Acidobacteriota bacterium]|nr:hypothetical protein [Acidobacteriota bacterium]
MDLGDLFPFPMPSLAAVRLNVGRHWDRSEVPPSAGNVAAPERRYPGAGGRLARAAIRPSPGGCQPGSSPAQERAPTRGPAGPRHRNRTSKRSRREVRRRGISYEISSSSPISGPREQPPWPSGKPFRNSYFYLKQGRLKRPLCQAGHSCRGGPMQPSPLRQGLDLCCQETCVITQVGGNQFGVCCGQEPFRLAESAGPSGDLRLDTQKTGLRPRL